MSGDDRNLHAAQAYARAGWPVFPCIPGEKVPSTSHGCRDATTDPDRIADWWSRNPGRNVAIATGAPGPDVVDIDNHGERGNGFAALNQIKREGLVDHPRAIVRTPSGGAHLYFAGSERPQGNGSLARHHIDFRGAGGYVVAPPSVVGQRPYEVVKHEPSAATVDFSAIRGLLDPQPERKAARERQPAEQRGVGHLPGWVAELQPHNRNSGLHWAACRAAEAGALDAGMTEQLVDAALRAGLRGGEQEARRTIASALQGASRPFDREREAG